MTQITTLGKLGKALSEESMQKVLHFQLLQQVVDKLDLDEKGSRVASSRHLSRVQSLLSKQPTMRARIKLRESEENDLGQFLEKLWQKAADFANQDPQKLPASLHQAAKKVKLLDPDVQDPAFLPTLFAFATEYYTFCIVQD